MKRLLNVLGALVSDLTQNELAARGACRCHKFRSGGFGMELHTYDRNVSRISRLSRSNKGSALLAPEPTGSPPWMSPEQVCHVLKGFMY